jgi:hypothetical protein
LRRGGDCHAVRAVGGMRTQRRPQRRVVLARRVVQVVRGAALCGVGVGGHGERTWTRERRNATGFRRRWDDATGCLSVVARQIRGMRRGGSGMTSHAPEYVATSPLARATSASVTRLAHHAARTARQSPPRPMRAPSDLCCAPVSVGLREADSFFARKSATMIGRRGLDVTSGK